MVKNPPAKAGEGSGNVFPYSGLKDPMDRGAGQASDHGGHRMLQHIQTIRGKNLTKNVYITESLGYIPEANTAIFKEYEIRLEIANFNLQSGVIKCS